MGWYWQSEDRGSGVSFKLCNSIRFSINAITSNNHVFTTFTTNLKTNLYYYLLEIFLSKLSEVTWTKQSWTSENLDWKIFLCLKLKDFRISIGFFFVLGEVGRGGPCGNIHAYWWSLFFAFSINWIFIYNIFFHMLITPIILEEKENFLLNSLKHNNKEK